MKTTDEGTREVFEYCPKPGFLTDPNDTTVGGDGFPFAGVGNRQLPEDLRSIGASHREEIPYR